MFDVDAGGVSYRESEYEQPGGEPVTAPVGELTAGLTVCYDLRFPELFRILALRGARLIAVPSAFTLATGRDHWEVLLRARAIENQALRVAPNQVGTSAAALRAPSATRRSSIPGASCSPRAPDGEGFVAADLDLAAQDRVRESLPSLANRRPDAYLWPQSSEGAQLMAQAPPADKRRQILDAAIRVFARQGFHATRVSDIADEAGVAYGLVYHYFSSKDEVLNELFVERWSLLLAAIEEADQAGGRHREKLGRGGQLHHRLLPPRPGADEGDHRRGHPRRQLLRQNPPGRRSAAPTSRSPRSSPTARRAGAFRGDVAPMFASMSFYGAIEQLLSGWIFDDHPRLRHRLRRGAGSPCHDDLRRPRAAR